MKIDLPSHQKAEALESIQRYLSEEIEVDISEMQAEFLFDFFQKELAPLAYNQGIKDAQKFLILKSEDLGGTCFEEGLTYWKNSKNKSGGVRRKPGD
ncbi:DUF2164 domain-containing protein [Roseibacillus persicicus]|uniref:DUF2164 domain-containing protein n=1 Tax=Roseibacillus persicicus TaxID=454148 RepID=UPI00280D6B36|nr:DUF2164 domain-containing protein [Roseibacillus persicicus]MDQ8191780.1 DUF2164 domain-containing protein [Roseibacillus persicicus]